MTSTFKPGEASDGGPKQSKRIAYQLLPDIGALAKKSNDNALSLVIKISNE